MLTLLARFHCLCLGLLALGGCLAAAEAPGDGEGAFSRTRHKAAALALLCHNPTPSQKKDFACQKCCLAALCRMFVQEGGYYAARVPAILEIRDPETAHVGLLLRELDGALPTGAQPRTLQMACAVALAYAAPSPSGVHAAVHAARLVEADVNNPAIARAAYSLLTAILGGEEDKERLLKIAAANADDAVVAQELRALRLREWRKLPDERTGVGRLCRALHVWLRARDWGEAERLGRQSLRYGESRRFLAVVCAAWFDLSGLPEDLLWESLNDREVRELCADLYQLAAGGVLIKVDAKLAEKLPEAQESEVRETPGGGLDGPGGTAPAAPRAPAMPAAPGAPAPWAAPVAPRTPHAPGRPAGERGAPGGAVAALPARAALGAGEAPEIPPAPLPAAAEVAPIADYLTASFPVE